MNLVREYISTLLVEKELRGQKTKRTLYHIGPRPAQPKPKMKSLSEWEPEAVDSTTGEKTGDYVSAGADDSWKRHWLTSPIKSGVFLTPTPADIASHHARTGNVYAYKIPEWVIEKSGGIHRYDRGSEILIPEDVWNEAGNEIEFLGKSMSEQELWDKVELLGTDRRRNHFAGRPGWMTVPEWNEFEERMIRRGFAGLRSTKHPEAAIKMMTPNERRKALEVFESEDYDEVRWEARQKDQELMDLLKRHMNEATLRARVKRILLKEAASSDEIRIEVTPDDIVASYRVGKFEKSDGNIRGTIVDDSPMYRVIDNLGLSMISKSGGRVTSGKYAVPKERAHGAQFGFDLDGVVRFGIGNARPRWRSGTFGTGKTYEPDYYPGRLQGDLWVLETWSKFRPFFSLSYPDRDMFPGGVNPFARSGSKDFDQETHDLILAYIDDMSDESHEKLEQHLDSLDLRLKKNVCSTSLGCSIHVLAQDIVKVYRVNVEPGEKYKLEPMSLADAQAVIKDKDVEHRKDDMPIRPKIARPLYAEAVLEKRILYHVPVTYRIEPGPIKARPLHSGKGRRSETEELKRDLQEEGFPPDSPVVWLSPEPISKLGPWYVIDWQALDEDRLIPTFQTGGYFIHVGDIPESAIINTHERDGLLREYLKELMASL